MQESVSTKPVRTRSRNRKTTRLAPSEPQTAPRATSMPDLSSIPPLLSDYDLHLFGEGSHLNIYEKMGAHLRTVNGITGVNFMVWAPNAQQVNLVGDFNGWDSSRHAMRKRIPSGVWELFVPDLKAGEKYKFQIRGEHAEVVDKSDPYGFAAELPPRTAWCNSHKPTAMGMPTASTHHTTSSAFSTVRLIIRAW